jgi:glycosyltransferase involved in cell wall biosynthesis
MIQISIIIPIYNAEKTISRCLESLQLQDFSIDNFEVILVDDSSTDHTDEIIRKKIKNKNNITYKKLEKNSWPSHARNIWASNAKYEYLAFIDSDAYADKNWLRNIDNAFKNNDIVACGGMVDNYNTAFFSNINHIIEFSEFYSQDEKIIKTIPSVNLIYKKEVFDQLQWFDEGLSIWEDSDLNFRLSKLGLKLYYIPQIKVNHDTQNNFIHSVKKQYKFWLNSFKYRRKNPESDYQFVFNKPLFVIAFPFYILWNVALYLKRAYFYKQIWKSIWWLLFIIFLRFIFWLWVGRYIFSIDKDNVKE